MAGKPDTWMPMYWGKFFLDTSEFDDSMTGAYASLLGHCWTRGGRLPDNDDQLWRLARSTPSRWKRQRDVLGRPPYFTVEGGYWTQKRLTAELEKATKTYSTSVENGKKGGRPRKRKETETETKTKPAGFENGKVTETQETLEQTTPKAQKSIEPSENQGFASQTLSGEPPDDTDLAGQKPHVNGKSHDKADRLRAWRAEAVSILAFLNEKTGRKYEAVAANVDLVVALLKTGVEPQLIRQVIAKKAREWRGDAKMDQYARPKTLFNRTNFANYAGEIVEPPADDGAEQ